jgi:hypothetical protein
MLPWGHATVGTDSEFDYFSGSRVDPVQLQLARQRPPTEKSTSGDTIQPREDTFRPGLGRRGLFRRRYRSVITEQVISSPYFFA